MYGKHFQSTYNGSMVGSGPVVFAVWGYVVSHTRDSIVEINPVILGAILGCPTSDVENAITKLCAPDEKSRSPENDGRRLVKKTEFAYFVPTYEKYQNIRNEADRREYMKNYMRDYRKNQQVADVNVNGKLSKPPLAHSYTDSDSNIDNKRRFAPPSLEEVSDYCNERKNGINPQAFIDHYTANGWVRGKTKIKDWKACVRTWESQKKPQNDFQGAI